MHSWHWTQLQLAWPQIQLKKLQQNKGSFFLYLEINVIFCGRENITQQYIPGIKKGKDM